MAWFPKLMGFPFLTRPGKTSSDESIGMSKELANGATVVHRDGLTVKTRRGKARPVLSEEGFVWLDSQKDRHVKNDDGEKGVRIRVKLKLTKEEAIRLLLKCKEGVVLEFRDVAHELARIPENRIVSVDVISRGVVAALESIPEENSIPLLDL